MDLNKTFFSTRNSEGYLLNGERKKKMKTKLKFIDETQLVEIIILIIYEKEPWDWVCIVHMGCFNVQSNGDDGEQITSDDLRKKLVNPFLSTHIRNWRNI